MKNLTMSNSSADKNPSTTISPDTDVQKEQDKLSPQEPTPREVELSHELQETKALLGKVLGSLNGHLAILDRDWRYTYVNDSAAQLLGLPKEQLLGHRIWDLFPEAVGNDFYRETHRAMAEQRNIVFEHYYEHWDRWFENHVSAFPDGISVYGIEITEQKRAEAKLRESEQKFAKIFHSSPLIVTITKLDGGRFVEVNETFERITGYTREDAIGRTPVELGLWVQPARRIEGLARLHTGVTVRDGEEYFRMKDGRELACVVSADTLEINGEKCVLTVLTDITERKHAEEALHELNALLEQRVEERTADLQRTNRELDQFVYVASHDLKAPLRAITALANWILEDAGEGLPPTSKTHFEKLQQRIQRMETLLNDLLIYSRAARQRHRTERVDSIALVERIVELLNVPATFSVTVSKSMPVLDTEEVALETVLRNVISNAYKHHHQPDSGHLWITAQEQNDWVEFAIRDDGPGIDEQFHERIFGVFQTLKPRDEVEGSGMGLALAKRLVEMRGGTIQVESAPDEGTTFRLTWPKVTAI
jgi:PAS domain S-box-containing protein